MVLFVFLVLLFNFLDQFVDFFSAFLCMLFSRVLDLLEFLLELGLRMLFFLLDVFPHRVGNTRTEYINIGIPLSLWALPSFINDAELATRMGGDYRTIQAWAVHNVADRELCKKIKQDIREAWGTDNTKAKAVYAFLYRLGEAENLPNTVTSIIVKDRVRTSTRQSCRACGTLHGDGYRCSPARGNDREDLDFFIGYVCAKKRLARYGLNVGVLAEADKRGAEKKKHKISETLEDLVLHEQGLEVLLITGAAGRNEEFIGNQLNWLFKHQDNLPEDAQVALKHLRDPYHRPTRQELAIVLQTVAHLRKFPADAYEGVAKDVELMAKEQLAPEDLARHLRQFTCLTAQQADELLSQTKETYRSFRLRKNTAFLNAYEDTSLAFIFDAIIPALEHDQPLWHDDLVNQRYVYNKVWAPQDYRLAIGCLNRWAFGSVKHLEGADRLRLCNIATRLESVPEFKEKIEGLVVLSRKLAYARFHTQSDEYARLKRVKEELAQLSDKKKYGTFTQAARAIAEVLKDPCRLLKTSCIPVEAFGDTAKTTLTLDHVLATITQAYTRDARIVDFQKRSLSMILEHTAYGIVRKADAKKLVRIYEHVKSYAPLEHLAQEQQAVCRLVREIAQSGLVKRIAGFPDFQRFREPLSIDPRIFKGEHQNKRLHVLQRVTALIHDGLARLPGQGPAEKKITAALEYLKMCRAEGYRVLDLYSPDTDWHSWETPEDFTATQPCLETYDSPQTKAQKRKVQVTFTDVSCIATHYERFATGVPAHSPQFQSLWNTLSKAAADGLLYERKWSRSRKNYIQELLPAKAREPIDALLTEPVSVQNKVFIARPVMTLLQQYAQNVRKH